MSRRLMLKTKSAGFVIFDNGYTNPIAGSFLMDTGYRRGAFKSDALITDGAIYFAKIGYNLQGQTRSACTSRPVDLSPYKNLYADISYVAAGTSATIRFAASNVVNTSDQQYTAFGQNYIRDSVRLNEALSGRVVLNIPLSNTDFDLTSVYISAISDSWPSDNEARVFKIWAE